ncbi:S1 RNA-binding domain-containing protein [Acetobacterium paludosum]|uniref:S1 RNA-binding domain-containing protein n=1 Tax=Acetobacterium paludosum TaxID=52693 RepID=A0A923HRY1_9FIRM|nr:Tex family protein [Acetobacterium paludosum]MBC3886712.1 S1 RNA-binding domain-containing protein [Acetobacterium paludosum]
MEYIINQLAKDFSIRPQQVADTINLIDGGNTIPFIARYRKEVTGDLSDALLRDLDVHLTYLRKLEKRKEEVCNSIEEQGKLTPELSAAIIKVKTLQEVEDLYLPYKQKKKTRASVAREKGLEPFAIQILEQKLTESELAEAANKYIDEEKEINSIDEVFQYAMDIIAEIISDNGTYRGVIRKRTYEKGQIRSTVVKGKEEENSELEMYFDHTEAIKTIKDHRILAINRGEKKKALSVKILAPVEEIEEYLKKELVQDQPSEYLLKTIIDSYSRLIAPAIEREIRTALKERAEEGAIKMFALNLKKLLLQPPFKDKVTMGFDPAFRTGCKIAVLDKAGKVLDYATIYPTFGKGQIEKAEREFLGLIERHQVDIIAIGNGTASRESEQFVAEAIKKTSVPVQYIVVNEAGASVYSASELGTEEYPDINVSIRGAISIGGRLQDPLSELVKIDPKHIGVGQYQHDVNQKELERVLEATVEDAVNNVGVNVNRASVSLLRYVAGVNKTIAKNILDYRDTVGSLKNRKELLKIKGLGAKAFEQCAGFLRIDDGDNVLDNTGVHPETYKSVEKMLKLKGLQKEQLGKKDQELFKDMNYSEMANQLEIGVPTLRDIVKELQKPGRDPRENAPKPHLRSDVLSMEDLEVDMELIGTIRNVIDFGAFVDIGVHQDGLVHISQITDRYIHHPTEVLSLGDVVTVKVLAVDLKRKRISLTMII